ncbi:MAG: hypothetical protein AAGJ50_09785 [Pseudomonadota bacterium]
MQPLIGNWRTNAENTIVARQDGASVRLIGRDNRRSASGYGIWLRFKLSCDQGTLEIPVEQRLVGYNSNFRALWYRADFRQAAPCVSLWPAAERLIVDALAIWPSGCLAGGLPTGIGVQGGIHNGKLAPELYRLFMSHYPWRAIAECGVDTPAKESGWTFESGDENCVTPDFENTDSYGSASMRRAIEAAGRRWPTLSSEGRMIVLSPADHGAIRILYADKDFQTDEICLVPCYAGQAHIWRTTRSKGGFISPPSIKVEGQDRPLVFDAIKTAFKQNGHKEKANLADAGLVASRRALGTLHEALFELEPEAIQTDKLNSPPSAILTQSPWNPSAQYITATRLTIDELSCAFSDEPKPELVLSALNGPAFDPQGGALTAPDGSVLSLERAAPARGLFPSQLHFRCRHAGIDWPVIVRREDQRPKKTQSSSPSGLLCRWVVDHDQCLSVWHDEGHVGFPDYSTWDCLRQFVEEAILSWGDGPAAGPAPQSLLTIGGWYDGIWRKGEFKRLMSRPFKDRAGFSGEVWAPYEPAARWVSKGPIWRPVEYDRAPAYQPLPSPPSMQKHRADDEYLRFFSSGFATRRVDRGEVLKRVDFVDLLEADDHLRVIGNRRQIQVTKVLRLNPDQSAGQNYGEYPWPKDSEFENADLHLCRSLRDAAEGGLRNGESATIAGCYLFNTRYDRTLRVTALGTDPIDFDYHMFAS